MHSPEYEAALDRSKNNHPSRLVHKPCGHTAYVMPVGVRVDVQRDYEYMQRYRQQCILQHNHDGDHEYDTTNTEKVGAMPKSMTAEDVVACASQLTRSGNQLRRALLLDVKAERLEAIERAVVDARAAVDALEALTQKAGKTATPVVEIVEEIVRTEARNGTARFDIWYSTTDAEHNLTWQEAWRSLLSHGVPHQDVEGTLRHANPGGGA